MRRRGCWNRSKFVADVLRDWFSREEWISGKGTRVGAISLLYGHRARGVLERVTGIQHDSGTTIVSAMHVHLSRDECLEVIAVKEGAEQIRVVADKLAAVRGVKSCKLTVVK